jgi:hypothetical protein
MATPLLAADTDAAKRLNEASVAAGPVGRTAAAQTDAQMRADICRGRDRIRWKPGTQPERRT